MADTRHVDTARGDVGRDEQLDVARTESLKRMGALRLALVALDRHRLDAGAREVAPHAAGAMLGPGEDQIGRAACRERVCQYVSISMVAVSLQKNSPTETLRTE